MREKTITMAGKKSKKNSRTKTNYKKQLNIAISSVVNSQVETNWWNEITF